MAGKKKHALRSKFSYRENERAKTHWILSNRVIKIPSLHPFMYNTNRK